MLQLKTGRHEKYAICRKRSHSMFAKVSSIEFLPGCEEEALNYILVRMFPIASTQHGFKDAFIFQNTAEQQKYTLISLWESLEAMQSSGPPEYLREEQQHFETLIAAFSQNIDVMFFQFSKQEQKME